MFEGRTSAFWAIRAICANEGLAHVPEDRQHRGLIASFDASESSILGWHYDEACGKGFQLDREAVIDRCKVGNAGIRRPPRRPVAQDGQNSPAATSRRSFLPAKSSAIPDLLIVGQPTRGVDIGAIEFIHGRLIALRDPGKAVLLVSVELDEIRSLSDRILVMFAGKIMGEREPRRR